MTKKVLLIKIINNELNELYTKDKLVKHLGDSGIDLYVPEEIQIKLGETVFVDLGIQCEVRLYNDENFEYKNLSYYLYPRSSISKTPLRLANCVGIIDAGYRGNIKAATTYVPTQNDLKRILEVNSIDCYPPYKIEKGTRLFQICSNDLSPFDEIHVTDSLSDTSRGEGGFGSTGKSASDLN